MVAMLPYGLKPLKVSHHLPKCCSHKDFGRRDSTILVGRVVFHDHVTLWVGTTQGKSASGQIEWPYRHCDSKDIMVLVCYVILQDNLTKEPSNFVNGYRSR